MSSNRNPAWVNALCAIVLLAIVIALAVMVLTR